MIDEDDIAATSHNLNDQVDRDNLLVVSLGQPFIARLPVLVHEKTLGYTESDDPLQGRLLDRDDLTSTGVLSQQEQQWRDPTWISAQTG